MITGLKDMRYRGNYLTWNDRHKNRITCKLDRALINAEWMGQYPDFEIEFRNSGVTFDRSSIIVCGLTQVEIGKGSLYSFIFAHKNMDFKRWLNIYMEIQSEGKHYVYISDKTKKIEKSFDIMEQE